MSLNRREIPGFFAVDKLHFPRFATDSNANGIKVYSLKAGSQNAIRLDFVFNAGLINQLKNAQSSFTASMLSEGTKRHSAIELAEALDFYGSYFQTKSNADDAVATLYCLEKHLENCLPLFLEAIYESTFPEKELEIQKKNGVQKLKVSLKKNNYICRKSFYKNLLGEDHPYAAFSEKSDLLSINTDDLKQFYQTNYIGGLKFLLLSGNFNETTLNLIQSCLGNSVTKFDEKEKGQPSIKSKFGKEFIEKTDSVQSAIRIGKLSIGRNHEDFISLQFLNLIFGGYFGSRLMKNIREDKGLTYGIYSVLEPFNSASMWYIDSDINTKNREIGIEEIYKELKKIRTEQIPNEELISAKNYFLGSFLRSLNGPFSLADRLKIMVDNKLEANYYPNMVSKLNSITSGDLMTIANKYLGEENIVEIVVGKK
ncbi:MAG: insulinase family protein [Bacteroidia bacterium]|nr:insulinase family protein [Bacteroidia bacterium]MCF8426341.1 insulinase family protein [Bacteroidia bacterium]MCF8445760.1 insulinase family protein [Bacteroidia bacterium]